MRYLLIISLLFVGGFYGNRQSPGQAGPQHSPVVRYNEGLELTHIAFALAFAAAPADSAKATITYHESPYLTRTKRYFASQPPAALIGHLMAGLKQRGLSYFVANRNGAPGLSIRGNQLQYTSPFGLGRQLAQNVLIGNAFSRHQTAWNDFARQYDFQHFFAQNKAYFDSLQVLTASHLHADRMQTWLETQFPDKSYQITVYISPLSGDLHSTSLGRNNQIYAFVPPLFSDSAAVSPLREARYANAVFTEIDHHYCNVGGTNARRVGKVFTNRAAWVNTANSTTAYYPTPEKVFDEYITHAVFLLYAQDAYDPVTFGQLKALRQQAMEQERGFIRFGVFVDELLRLKKTGPKNQTVIAMYPALIDWCARQ